MLGGVHKKTKAEKRAELEKLENKINAKKAKEAEERAKKERKKSAENLLKKSVRISTEITFQSPPNLTPEPQGILPSKTNKQILFEKYSEFEGNLREFDASVSTWISSKKSKKDENLKNYQKAANIFYEYIDNPAEAIKIDVASLGLADLPENIEQALLPIS